jgi:hypothetical protein
MPLSTKTSSDPLRDTQIHLRRALGPARASRPPDGAPARGAHQGARLKAIPPRTGCLTPTITSLTHAASIECASSARLVDSASPPCSYAHDLAMAMCVLDRRSHGRPCARSGCTCPAVSCGSGGTSMGSRRRENRRLAVTDMLGRCNVGHHVRSPLARFSCSHADSRTRKVAPNPHSHHRLSPPALPSFHSCCSYPLATLDASLERQRH